MEKPAQYMQEIVCPKCAQQGHATWRAASEKGELRELATLSDGFKTEQAPRGEDPKIICKNCGHMQANEKSVGA